MPWWLEIPLWGLVLCWAVVLGVLPGSLGRQLRATSRSDLLWLLTLTVFALALHGALGSWGVGDDQPRLGNAWAGDFPAEDFHKGSAPTVLLSLLFEVFGICDRSAFALGVLLSALAPPLLVLAARGLRLSHVASFGAGFALAMMPVHIVFGTTLTRYPYALFTAVLSLWALARFRATGHKRLLVLLVASLWLCARSRPEAGTIVVLVGLAALVLSREGLAFWRDSRARSAIAAVTMGGMLSLGSLLLSARLETDIANHLGQLSLFERWSVSDLPILGSRVTPPTLLMLAALGVGGSLLLPLRPALWAFTALIVSLALNPREGEYFWHLRYHSLTVMMLSLMVGVGLSYLVRVLAWTFRGRYRLFLLMAVTALFFTSFHQTWTRSSRLGTPLSIEREYRFLKATAKALPLGSVVYVPTKEKDSISGVFRGWSVLNALTAHGVRFSEIPPGGIQERGRDTYFYQSSSCSMAPPILEGRIRTYASSIKNCIYGRAISNPISEHFAIIPTNPLGYENFYSSDLFIGIYSIPAPQEGDRIAR